MFVSRAFFFRGAFFVLPSGLSFLSRLFFGHPLRSLFVFLCFSLSGFLVVAFGLGFPTAHFDPETNLSKLVSDQNMAAEVEALGYRDAPCDKRNSGEDHNRAGKRQTATFQISASRQTQSLSRWLRGLTIPVHLSHKIESDRHPLSLNVGEWLAAIRVSRLREHARRTTHGATQGSRNLRSRRSARKDTQPMVASDTVRNH